MRLRRGSRSRTTVSAVSKCDGLGGVAAGRAIAAHVQCGQVNIIGGLCCNDVNRRLTGTTTIRIAQIRPVGWTYVSSTEGATLHCFLGSV